MAKSGPVGARGKRQVDELVLAYSESTTADSHMIAEDIWGSQAHAIMLGRQGIIAPDVLRSILSCLEEARQDHQRGKLKLKARLEDVHMNVEDYVRRKAGPDAAGRLHTARSRNDQVVTDTRMHLRVRLLAVQEALGDLREALLDVAKDHADTVMPGYTHTQHAQPITLGFWATAHAEALSRDADRLAAAYERTNQCPLGACALAGTSFDSDRKLTAELLGFGGVVENSLDAVGSRDFVLEALSALAILAANLSRLCEEVVVWSSHEYGMFELDDAVALGSSIMPQKKNPCVAELARGRAGLVYGALMHTLSALKSVPGGYNRDLQEDRLPLWESLHASEGNLRIMAHVIGTMEFHTERMAELAGANFATATELANYLVAERGMAFRECHEMVGGTVAALAQEGKTFADLERVGELLAAKGVELNTEELRSLLDPAQCVARQRSLGSTAPREVRRMARKLRQGVQRDRRGVAKRRASLSAARRRTQQVVDAVLAGRTVTQALRR
ncbi:MAG: argininosuccinate lyase [Armatimonadota bacterium]